MLKFAFFGTPDVAQKTLEILKERGFVPNVIVTSPDRPQGRGMLLESTPVAKFADENNITCYKPESLGPDFIAELRNKNFDLFVVVAYGKILPEEILNLASLGSINVHYSLLPKYRGAAPVESAILNGDTETGVSIQKMRFKMDTGPVIAIHKVSILPDEKAPELRERLISIGGELLANILPAIENNEIQETEQDESLATYSKKIKKEDGLINLEDDAAKNFNKFRAYAYWPRTYFLKDGKRIIVTDAALLDGKFVIKKVIPEGKKEITWEEFSRTNNFN
jgi:methionyl-tRNA formyltransferase